MGGSKRGREASGKAEPLQAKGGGGPAGLEASGPTGELKQGERWSLQ